jgi:UDP-hydrolysing UDP-N-acetyl-D-glucosamine 2-epimerase
MHQNKKICIVTGSRAEYGLLSRLMILIQDDSELDLQIIATNMHLSPEFGLSYKEIENDGFRIDKKVEMLLSSDTSTAITKSVGLATIGFADAYEDLKPDLLLVLGDRYEILAAVTAALFNKIPVAHLHGGEITEGAYDDAIRHSITKMSHLHFTSIEEYQKRVIQLGEEPSRVFNFGAIGIDNIKHLELIPKQELEKRLNFKFGGKCVLVTFHSETLGEKTSEEQNQCLLQALKSIDDLRIIFTHSNSDTNGRIIMQMINKFVEDNKNRSIAFASLGQLKYLSVLPFIDAVVGNSSSGIIEVPSFGIPTINIGNRQLGRIKSKTIVDCEATFEDIRKKLKFALSSKFKEFCKNCTNPYEKENTATEILTVIKNYKLKNLIQKKFYNI